MSNDLTFKNVHEVERCDRCGAWTVSYGNIDEPSSVGCARILGNDAAITRAVPEAVVRRCSHCAQFSEEVGV